MKSFKWIMISFIVLIALLFVVSRILDSRNYKIIDKAEPDNKSLTFIGNDKRSYNYSQACQLKDGSVAIASVLSQPNKIREAVSIIKLSPEGKFLWEKKFTFAKLSIWNFVPGILRKEKGHQYLETLRINFVQDKYYLLLSRDNLQTVEPFIITLDSEGKLIKSNKINLKLGTASSAKSFMQNNFAYISYLDIKDKLIGVAKLDIKTREIVKNPVLFYKQNDLIINAVTADKADTTISMTAYDSKKGCSFYMYTPKEDLKEYFRTEPSSEFTVLKYIDDRLYGVVKEDSLLRIVDLTSLSRPLIIFADTPRYKDFRATDLQIVEGYFYVCFDVINQNKQEVSQDIVIMKYSQKDENHREYFIKGKKHDAASFIFKTADKQLLVIGNSSSLKLGMGNRVFASKVKL